MKGISIFLLLILLPLTACTTVKTPNAEFSSPGSVAVLDVKANGDVRVEKIDSPLTDLIATISKGMWGAIMSMFR